MIRFWQDSLMSMLGKNVLSSRWLLVAILVVAALLRCWQMSTFDIYRDESMNAFRGVGMFDFLGTDRFQTSPVNLYADLPWWARFSFHDAPPLVFFIWNMFFNLFGDSTLILRLPFVIAGLAITALLYVELKRTRGALAAVTGAAAFAISSFAVWTALSANHEGIAYLFVTLAAIYFARFFKAERQRELLIASVSFSLALLSKYTALFLLPAVGLYLLLWKRRLLSKVRTWRSIGFSLIVSLVLLSPVIVYNYFTWETRGHFDAALSSMVGMQPEDFKGIAGRAEALSLTSVAENGVSVVRILSQNTSMPFFLLFAASVLLMLYRAVRGRADELERLTLLCIGSLWFMFVFLAPADRYVSLFTPFMALAIGMAIAAFFEMIAQSKKIFRAAAALAVGVVFISELLFSINTNVALRPIGSPGLWYAPQRLENLGYEDLERYLRTRVYATLPAKRVVVDQSDLEVTGQDIAGKPIVFYDDSIHWSAWLWYFLRYQTYYKLPMVSTEYLLGQGNGASRFVQEIAKVSGREVYFIKAVDPSVSDSVNYTRERKLAYIEDLAKQLDVLHVPFEEIRNKSGVVVFRSYLLKDRERSYIEQIRF